MLLKLPTVLTRFRKYRSLPYADRRLLLDALVLHSVAAVAIRVLSLHQTLTLLQRLATYGLPIPAISPQRIVWACSVVARPWPGTCLTLALCARALLHKHGYSATVTIGVQRDTEGHLHAHAWLAEPSKDVNADTKDHGDFVPLLTI